MEEWYYTKGGQQQGPVNLETLRNMASRGELKPEDMVWNSTMKDWVPSSEVDGIHTGEPATEATEATAPSLAPGDVGPPPSIGSWASDPNLQEVEPGSDPLDIGKIFSTTLEVTKRHFQLLILMGLIVMGVSMVLSFTSQIVTSVGGAILDTPPPPEPDFENVESFEDIMDQMSPSYAMAPALLVFVVLFQIISNVLNLYLSLGLTRVCLNLIEGKEAQLPMLFGQADKLLKAIGASILNFIFIMVGLVFLIIPGIYLALRLSATIPAIVDRNMGVMEAINYSFRITKGHSLMIFVLWLIAAVGGGIAILITCGLGAIVVAPVLTLGWVLCYRWMQYGSRVAE